MVISGRRTRMERWGMSFLYLRSAVIAQPAAAGFILCPPLFIGAEHVVSLGGWWDELAARIRRHCA